MQKDTLIEKPRDLGRVRARSVIITAVIAPAITLMVFGGDPVGLVREATSSHILQFCSIFGGAVICAIVSHIKFHHWFVACFVSAIAFTFVLQVMSFISLGYLDPFFPIALVTGGLLGFAVAAIVGLLFQFFRTKKLKPSHNRSAHTCDT